MHAVVNHIPTAGAALLDAIAMVCSSRRYLPRKRNAKRVATTMREKQNHNAGSMFLSSPTVSGPPIKDIIIIARP